MIYLVYPRMSSAARKHHSLSLKLFGTAGLGYCKALKAHFKITSQALFRHHFNIGITLILCYLFLGRAGAKGLAVSFFTDKASKMASELVVILREANQEVPSQLEGMRSFGGGGGGRYGGR